MFAASRAGRHRGLRMAYAGIHLPESIRPPRTHSDTLHDVEPKTFCAVAVRLTGTAVKGVGDGELSLLRQIVADDATDIDHSQLNELLLLVNKDRMGKPMFRFV